MLGRRFPDAEWVDQPGGYSKHAVVQDGVTYTCWLVQAPSGGRNFFIGLPNAVNADYHWVEEHEDGTITVRPYPEDAPPGRSNSNSVLAPNGWHGYIYRGEWSAA